MATNEEIAYIIARWGNKCPIDNCGKEIYNIEDALLLGEIFEITQDLRVSKIEKKTSVPLDIDRCLVSCLEHFPGDRFLKIGNNKLFNEIPENPIHLSRLVDVSLELKEVDFDLEKEILNGLSLTLPPKKSYEIENSYIFRSVFPVVEGYNSWAQYPSLSELIRTEKRIVLLGVAGFGKSFELLKTATILSSTDSMYFPILIRLKDVTDESIDQLINQTYPEWNIIPHSRLVLLIDALDEVNSQEIDTIVKKINKFSELNSRINIVVSCRNNFYSSELEGSSPKLSKFRTYYLTPLSHFQIRQYIAENIPENVENVISVLHDRNYFDLLKSPFYLVRIVNYFIKYSEFPKSRKDLFEYLIESRFEKDKEKYVNGGQDLDARKKEVRNILEKIAVLMLCMGRNDLSGSEILTLIDHNNDLFEAVKKSFLFDKSISEWNHWEFEHNQFKEYLAASYLEKLSFKEIKKLSEIAPGYSKIRPHWLNTIVLLISILEKSTPKTERITGWLVNSDPEALVRAEKDKISLENRVKIYKKIINGYESKKVFVSNRNFNLEDLVSAISDSNQVFDELIGKLRSSSERVTISQCITMLQGFDEDIIHQHRYEIQEILFHILAKSDVHYDVVNESLILFGKLNLDSKQTTDKIVKLIDWSSSHARSGFYEYIKNSNHVADYLSELLNCIFRIEKVKVLSRLEDFEEEKEPALSLEEYNLEALLKNLVVESNIENIIRWANSNIPETGRQVNSLYFRIVDETLLNAAKWGFNDNKNFCSLVADLAFNFADNYHTHGEVNFYRFFENSVHSEELFHYYLESADKADHRKLSYEYVCGYVFNNFCSNSLLDSIASNNLSEDTILKIRSILSWNANKDHFKSFYENLIKIAPSFKFPEQKKREEYGSKRILWNCEIIQSEERIIELAEKIFKKSGKARLSRIELIEYRTRWKEDDSYKTSLVASILKDLAGDGGVVSLENLKKFLLNSEKWDFYRIQHLYNLDQNNSSFKFDKKNKDFVLEWVTKNLVDCVFSQAVKMSDDGTINAKYRELYCAYFVFRFNIPLTKETALDLLDYPPRFIERRLDDGDKQIEHSKVIDEVTRILGEQEVEEHIKSSIQKDDIYEDTRLDFLLFASKKKFKEAQKEILKEIKGKRYRNYQKNELIEKFIESGGEPDELIGLIPHVDFDLKLKLIDTSLKIGSSVNIEELILVLLEYTDKSEDQLELISRLKKLNKNLHFEKVFVWILENQRFPNRQVFTEIDKDHLDQLMYIFQDSIIKNYGGNPRGFDFDRNVCLDPMIDIGSYNFEAYQIVRNNLNKWLAFGDSMKFLHYRLQELDERYYLNHYVLSYDEAVKLLSDILPESTWRKDWNSKSLPAKIWFIIGIPSAIYGLWIVIKNWIIPLFN